MDFPTFRQSASLNRNLYAVIPYISIYSNHIRVLVEHSVFSAFRISIPTLRKRDRTGSVALARQTAMYLAHVTFGLTYSEVGRLFCRDRTTVAHACSAIEGLRDDPCMDRTLSTLENALILFHPQMPKR